MKINSVIAGVAATVIVVGLGAMAAISAHVNGSAADEAGRLPVAVAASTKFDKRCDGCGVVVAIKQIEPKEDGLKRYQIQVRMTDGSLKTLTSSTQPSWKTGERVRLHNG
jgi:hypothetical protein